MEGNGDRGVEPRRMRIRRFSLVLAVLAVSLAPAARSVFVANAVDCPSVEAPPALSFDAPTFIDAEKAGGEPVSVVAQDGSINVSAHAGTTHVYKDPKAASGAPDFAVGYANQTLNWRSVDGGKSWRYIGIAGLPVGPHSATSTGFSDPDYAIDAGGRIYNTEIDLANVSVFSSDDDGQSYNLANPEVSSGDRPWLTAADKDEVFLYINTLQQILRSTDGGITWMLQSINNSAGPKAKMYVNPLNKATGLVGPHGSGGVSISNDEAKTWTAYDGAGLGSNVDFFGAMAVDSAGYVYRGAAGGYGGPNDTTPSGEVSFNYFDQTTKKWGEEAVTIPTPDGDAMWPWFIAGDDGRAAMVWYQSLAGKPTEFYIFAAYTTNAHGTTVTCSDGSTKYTPPQFSVANASGRPIHKGYICLQGTTCNADPSFAKGDRRLGDFLTINYDADGNLFIVSGDTTLLSPTGGPKLVGNPIFMKARSGTPLLAKPMTLRKTRCIANLPVCP